MPTFKRCAVMAPHRGGRLELIEQDVPKPGSKEVLIRVHRAGVAFGDIMRARALFAKPSAYPFTPGYDVAGEVIGCGPQVTRFSGGERVAAYTQTGGYTQVAAVPEHRVMPLPRGIAYAEAVTLVLNYLTAYQMMHRVVRVREEDSILVHSAAGGVGTALLQLGRLHRLKMYGTASRGKHALVQRLGARPIDYRSRDFVEAVRQAKPEGLEAVFEAVSIDNAYRSRSLLKKGGTLVYFGFVGLARDPRYGGKLSRLMLRLLPLLIFSRGAKTRLYFINVDRRRDWFREDMERLFRLSAEGKIRPLVHKTFPLDQAYEAQEYLFSGQGWGKILLDCAGQGD